jgi:tape measure domain-containing protein
MANVKSNILDLNQVYTDLNKTLDENIKRLNTGAVAIERYNKVVSIKPSEYAKGLEEINTKTKQLEESNKRLEAQVKRLTEAKAKSNAKTSEEIVNQRALASASDRQARANSRLVGAYANLNAQHQIAMQRVRDLTVAYGSQHRATIQAQKDFDVLDKKIKQADKAVNIHNRNVGNYKSALSGLSNLMGAFGIAGGLTLFAQITMDTVRLIKELQSLNLALQQVSGTEADFTSNLSFIQETSENLGLSINDLTKQFTQFYVSAKDKLGRNEIENIFTSIAKAGATMGLSLEQQNRAFLAINQMMSKGTVQAEELRGQLGEALPGAFTIMAKAIGVTEKELGKMLQRGEVLAKDVLPAFATELEKAYGIENITNVKTLTAETNRLGNAWTNFVKEIDSGNGIISKFLTTMIGGITELIKDVSRLQKAWTFLDPDASMEKLRKSYRDDEKETLQRIGEQAGKDQLQQIKGLKAQTDYAKDLIRIKLEQSNLLVDEISQLKKRNEFLRNRIPETNLSEAKLFRKEIELNNEKIIKNNNIIISNRGQIKSYNNFLNQKTEATKKSTDETDKNTQATTKNTASKKEQTKSVEELLKGTEAWYNQLISDLKKEQSTLADSTEQYKIYADAIAEVEKQLNLLKNGREKLTGVEITPIGGNENGNELEERLKAETEALILLNENTEKGKELMKQYADEIVNAFGMDLINNSGLTNFFDLIENGLDRFGENWEAKASLIMEATQEMFNFISGLSQANFDEEYEREARRKETALLFAGESAEAKAEIERESERRTREIRKREAKAQRSQAMFNIGIDTAQAIMRAWATNPKTAPFMTAIIAGVGIAQIASIASRPLPEFWKGTDNAPEGLALTQERGREIITDAKGIVKSWGSDNGAQLTHLNKGDKVLKHSDTMRQLNKIMAVNNILPPKENILNFAPIERKLDKLTGAILNKESFKIVTDSNGQRYFEEKDGQNRELKNARLNMTQRNV